MTESWVETGYKANFTRHLGLFFLKMRFMIVHACLHSFVLHDCFDGSTQQLSLILVCNRAVVLRKKLQQFDLFASGDAPSPYMV